MYRSLSSAFLILSLTSSVFSWAAGPSSNSTEDFVAHEWGTFTSLQDSNGKTAEGMYHEEESLPDFVHGRNSTLQQRNSKNTFAATANGNGPLPTVDWSPNPYPCHGKDCDFDVIAGTPLSVTQKMETPVIYFYSREARSVQVDVDFPGGIITQYYPDVSDFSPPLGKVDAVANGHIHWDAQVSAEKLPVPEVSSSSIWAPSRQVHSNYVSVGGENEKLLFYRGLGNFEAALRVNDTSGNALTFQNQSAQSIAQAFLLNVTSTNASVRALGSIPAHGQIAISHLSMDQQERLPLGVYVSRISGLLVQALEHSGLYHDEALAMVNTWQKSYFTTPGLRVLYVLPREWTDRLLPLALSPEPKELVRTLVGRVEILTQSEEAGLLGDLRHAFLTNTSVETRVNLLGRFAEAKLRRIHQIAEQSGEEKSFLQYLDNLVQQATTR